MSTEVEWIKSRNSDSGYCNILLMTVDRQDVGNDSCVTYFGDETRCIVDRGCGNILMGRTLMSIQKGKKVLVS